MLSVAGKIWYEIDGDRNDYSNDGVVYRMMGASGGPNLNSITSATPGLLDPPTASSSSSSSSNKRQDQRGVLTVMDSE